MTRSTLTLLVLLSLRTPAAIAEPQPGERFAINSKTPKYDAVLFVFDAEGRAWSSYCHGRPVDGGHWTYDPTGHRGAFSLAFTRIAQNSGDQSRRVLGESVVDGRTDVRIRLVSLGKPRTIVIHHEDDYRPIKRSRKTPDGTKEVTRTPAVLEVAVRGVTTKVDAELRIKSGGKTSIKIDGFCRVKGSDLGLERHPGPLDARFWFKAFPEKG